MARRLVQVNVKARDDPALGRFRAEALGWVKELGATHADMGQGDAWTVLADPEGNEFGVLAPGLTRESA